MGDQGLAAPDRRRDVRPDRSAAGRSTAGSTSASPASSTPARPRRSRWPASGTIPADAIAVTGNVTVTGQTAAGYVSITTTATTTPRSSTLNFPSGDTRANNLTASLASNGTLAAVYKAAAGKKAHVIFDVTGYFLPGTEDAALQHGHARSACSTPGRPHRPARPVRQRHAARARPSAASGASRPNAVAITANLTVVGQTKGGFVSVTPDERPQPDDLEPQLPDRRHPGQRPDREAVRAGKLWLVYKAAAGARTHLDPRRHRLLPARPAPAWRSSRSTRAGSWTRGRRC